MSEYFGVQTMDGIYALYVLSMICGGALVWIWAQFKFDSAFKAGKRAGEFRLYDEASKSEAHGFKAGFAAGKVIGEALAKNQAKLDAVKPSSKRISPRFPINRKTAAKKAIKDK